MRKNIRLHKSAYSEICMCVKHIKKHNGFVCYTGLSKNDIKIARALVKKRAESKI